jgi:hypothetical protein
MMKKVCDFRRIVLSLAIVVGLLAIPAASVSAAGPNLFTAACNGNTEAAVCNHRTTTDPLTGTNGVIGKVTKVVALFGGAVAVIIMITGGFMYVLSGGDAGKVSRAKDTLIYAAVGLVVIALAQSIIVFVIDRV